MDSNYWQKIAKVSKSEGPDLLQGQQARLHQNDALDV
jgi:hypothetical protein